jgi:hypothetical protein
MEIANDGLASEKGDAARGEVRTQTYDRTGSVARLVDGEYDRGIVLAAVRRATAAIARSDALWNHFGGCPVS